MNRLLMIAFHFPPYRGSSGIQRTLRFVQHLPEMGWEPVVLTAHPRAYERRGSDLEEVIPSGVEVIRAAAFDTARHLAVAGRYPSILARPDRWISWWPAALRQGLSAVARLRPTAIWSTFPIATAHKIGASLARRTGLPWIADFRDPMAQPGYPEDPATWRSYYRVERETVELASRCVFTAPTAAATYRARYAAHAHKMCVIENGYDEEAFADVAFSLPARADRLTLLHSGTVYPSERDPTALFKALRQIKECAPLLYAKLTVRFRAAHHDESLRQLASTFGVEAVVDIQPTIGYRQALQEMVQADGLLLLQARNCNEQIAAKVYEYLRAGRPILGLTDVTGDTAATMRRFGMASIAPLEDAEAIAKLLMRFLSGPAAIPLPDLTQVESCTRRRRARELAQLLVSLT